MKPHGEMKLIRGSDDIMLTGPVGGWGKLRGGYSLFVNGGLSHRSAASWRQHAARPTGDRRAAPACAALECVAPLFPCKCNGKEAIRHLTLLALEFARTEWCWQRASDDATDRKVTETASRSAAPFQALHVRQRHRFWSWARLAKWSHLGFDTGSDDKTGPSNSEARR
jgi:hypothetical protein